MAIPVPTGLSDSGRCPRWELHHLCLALPRGRGVDLATGGSGGRITFNSGKSRHGLAPTVCQPFPEDSTPIFSVHLIRRPTIC